MMASAAPKISILMPVYNVEPYLPQAIDSVLAQTMPDFELICVDDGSTDGSGDILRRYAARDARIRPLFHDTNRGLVAARTTAAAAARGQYILLLDSDDTLFPTACETVWREEEKNPVDILQFGTQVRFESPVPEPEKAHLRETLQPGRSRQGDLLTACFRDRLWSHTLWNKAYRAGLWQQILEYISPAYINIAEDEYLFFLLSYFARSYRGIPEPLYCYNLGRGLTGQITMTATQFGSHVAGAAAYDAIEEFLSRTQSLSRLAPLLADMRREALTALVCQWFSRLPVADSRTAFRTLVDTWGLLPVVEELVNQYWDSLDDILARLVPSSAPVREKKGIPVRTIGVFYYRMANGGVERVLSYLLPLWRSMGYRVVLMTEQPPSPEDYPLPADLERVQIPATENSARRSYPSRARAWKETVERYGIDTVVYAAHVCALLPWDLLVLKGLGCNCIVHSHSIFSFLYYEAMPNRFTLTHAYRLADRVVTLARVCNTYWGNFCPSFYIPNPVGKLCPPEEVSRCTAPNLLWVGRLSPEKQPADALRAFALIRRQIPEATLTVVGTGETDAPLEELQTLARTLHLEDAVRFEGFQAEVGPYYRTTAALLFTSRYEGFPMVLVESKSHGVPIVMYDLSYLETVRDQRGVISVPQCDVSRLAEETVRLLRDGEYRQRMCAAARCSAEDLAAFDLAGAWRAVFDSLETPTGQAYVAPEESRLMMNLLLDNAQSGSQGAVRSLAGDEKALRLVNSKFMQIADRYWSLTDPVKEGLKRVRKRLRRRLS